MKPAIPANIALIGRMLFPSGSGSLDSNWGKADWLIRLRWTALIAIAIAGWMGRGHGFIQLRFLPGYFGIVLLLAVWNLFTARHMLKNAEVSHPFLLIQLTVDAVALSLLIALSGGSSTPLLPMVFLHAGVGALLLPWSMALAYLGVIVLCIGFLSFQTFLPLAPSQVHSASLSLFGSYLFVAGVIWLLTAWLSRTLRNQEKRLDGFRRQAVRMEHLRGIDALSAGFSHEFSTPLNTLKIRLTRIARISDPATREEVDSAMEAIGQCESSLRRFMQSRLDPELFSLKSVPFQPTLERIVSEYRVTRPGINLAFHGGGGDRTIRIPVHSFSQAVHDLLDNAYESAGADSLVDIRLGRERENCICEIIDRGPGFPSLILENIGKPFVSTKEDGSGLGLYNARSLAQALGGILTIENLPGRGAKVRILLPEWS